MTFPRGEPGSIYTFRTVADKPAPDVTVRILAGTEDGQPVTVDGVQYATYRETEDLDIHISVRMASKPEVFVGGIVTSLQEAM